MNPQVAFQISSRLPHLALRMREHGARAQATAEQLSLVSPALFSSLPTLPPSLACYPISLFPSLNLARAEAEPLFCDLRLRLSHLPLHSFAGHA